MKKNRELRAALCEMGFSLRQGKGSHEVWMNDAGVRIVLCGNGGRDAKPYQAKRIRRAWKRSDITKSIK